MFVATLGSTAFDPDVEDDNIPNDSFQQVTGSNGRTKATFPGSSKADSSCDKMRRMYVTLTPIAPQ